MLTEQQFGNWITALRSGKYNQFRGGWYAKKDNSFCCLGLLGYLLLGEPDYYESWNLHDITCDSLEHGILDRNMFFDNLVDLNDEKEYSFEQIADWLEQHKSEFVYDQHQ